MVVAWTMAVVLVETPRRWKATRNVQEGDDVRRKKERRAKTGEEVKAMSWSRWKKIGCRPIHGPAAEGRPFGSALEG